MLLSRSVNAVDNFAAPDRWREQEGKGEFY